MQLFLFPVRQETEIYLESSKLFSIFLKHSLYSMGKKNLSNLTLIFISLSELAGSSKSPSFSFQRVYRMQATRISQSGRQRGVIMIGQVSKKYFKMSVVT